jgi:hypothetical protein
LLVARMLKTIVFSYCENVKITISFHNEIFGCGKNAQTNFILYVFSCCKNAKIKYNLIFLVAVKM